MERARIYSISTDPPSGMIRWQATEKRLISVTDFLAHVWNRLQRDGYAKTRVQRRALCLSWVVIRDFCSIARFRADDADDTADADVLGCTFSPLAVGGGLGVWNGFRLHGPPR